MSFEAEQAVIGCMLMDSEAKYEAQLSPEMFTDNLLGRLYFEIRMIEGKVDPIILRSKVPADEIPDEVFYKVLNECGSKAATSIEVGKYAEIVRSEYVKRQITEIVRPDSTIDEIIGQLEALQYGKRKVTTAKDLVEKYSKNIFTPNKDIGFDTGFQALDKVLNGMFRGDVCVIGARPSVGKSAFVIEMLINMAKAGIKVTLFSLEMSNEQVYNRILAHESGISVSRIKRATSYIGREEDYVSDANKVIGDLDNNLNFFDDVYKISEMIPLSRGRDVIIVDYAQLVSPTGEYRGQRYAEVGAISHAFKRMAKKLNIAVVLLAQLNRVSEQTETKEPQMSELREGGDFEQDASQIVLMWNKNKERTLKGVKVEKNRDATVGTIDYKFDGATNHFTPKDLEDCPFQ